MTMDPKRKEEAASSLIEVLKNENDELKKALKNTLKIMQTFDEQRAYEYLANKCEDLGL
jgi:hypothetical protein